MKFLFISGNIASRLLRFALPVLGAEKNEKAAKKIKLEKLLLKILVMMKKLA